MHGQVIQSINFDLVKLFEQFNTTWFLAKWGVVKKIKKKSFDEDLFRNKYFSGQLILRPLQKGLLKIKKKQKPTNKMKCRRDYRSKSKYFILSFR